MRDVEKKVKYREVLESFLEDVFSNTIAYAFLNVLRFHIKKVLGKDLIDSILENPVETYRALYKVLGAVGAVRLLETAMARYIETRYMIPVDNKLLTNLKNGDNKALLDVALRIYSLKYPQRQMSLTATSL